MFIFYWKNVKKRYTVVVVRLRKKLIVLLASFLVNANKKHRTL